MALRIRVSKLAMVCGCVALLATSALADPLRLTNVRNLPPGVTAPKLISIGPPFYPELARRLSQQGVVYLWITVSETGEVTDAVVARSSGFPELDTGAIQAEKGMRYTPATQNGKPIAASFMTPLKFTLR